MHVWGGMISIYSKGYFYPVKPNSADILATWEKSDHEEKGHAFIRIFFGCWQSSRMRLALFMKGLL